ncbi:MAG: hypothetical protein HC793_04610, partial [Aquincola sp.]|nr:hypothetical protein [Aquincola sp.]
MNASRAWARRGSTTVISAHRLQRPGEIDGLEITLAAADRKLASLTRELAYGQSGTYHHNAKMALALANLDATTCS